MARSEKNPFEGYRTSQQQKPPRKMIDR